MRSRLFRLKQIGVLFLLAGLAWVASIAEIGLIFGLSLSFQSAVMLLAFRWYGRAAGLSLALAASLHQFFFLQHTLTAMLCLAEILFAAACLGWIRSKGLLPCAAVFWLGIGPALAAGLYAVSFGHLGTELWLGQLHYAGNGFANALLAELIFCYLPWRPENGWKRENASLSFRHLLRHISLSAIVFPFLLFIGIVSSFLHDENGSHAHRLSENVFLSLAYELSTWEEQDLGMLQLNALVQMSRLDAIIRSYEEASGAEIIVETEERHDKEGQLSPGFSVWLPNQTPFFELAQWSSGYYAYEAALEEAPLRITVLVPTAHYLQRVQYIYAVIYSVLLGLIGIGLAAGSTLIRWISGELQRLAHLSARLQEPDQAADAWPSSPVEEIRRLIAHFKDLLQQQAAKLQELRKSNQALSGQAKKLSQSKAYWEKLACHDPLTGLHNRLFFTDTLERQLVQQYGSRLSVGVIFMDLDNFKFVNDCYGHAAGDELLKQVAERIRLAAQKGDVCRLGGDEFVVLVPMTSPEEVERLSQQIVQALQRPFSIEGHELQLKSSLGISLYPQDAYDVKTMMQYADMAMYRAKASGGNRYVLYGNLPGAHELHAVTKGGER